MPNQKQVDPYLYLGTQTLINKFDIKNPDDLQELEAMLFLSKKSDPLPKGNFDYNHLKAIHQHYFGDVYEWQDKKELLILPKAILIFVINNILQKN